MLVGEGVSVLAPGRHVKKEHLELVRGVLSSVGKVVVVPESQIDAVTAVSGSGPAYFFLVAEAMIEAGVGLGLTRATASELVVQTMVGSAAMLDRSGGERNRTSCRRDFARRNHRGGDPPAGRKRAPNSFFRRSRSREDSFRRTRHVNRMNIRLPTPVAVTPSVPLSSK